MIRTWFARRRVERAARVVAAWRRIAAERPAVNAEEHVRRVCEECHEGLAFVLWAIVEAGPPGRALAPAQGAPRPRLADELSDEERDRIADVHW